MKNSNNLRLRLKYPMTDYLMMLLFIHSVQKFAPPMIVEGQNDYKIRSEDMKVV